MTARVLVVDDIPANVKLLEARLSAEYFEVLTAHSRLSRRSSALQSEHVDVVLLDVMMPGMDGFEVCRRIKASPKTMHVPVIMVTALDQPSDKVQGLEAGADDFLTKPVDDIALVTRVKNLTRLKMLNDELMLRVATGSRDRPAVRRRVGGPRGGTRRPHPARGRHEPVAKRIVAALGKVHRSMSSPTCRRRLLAWPTSRTTCSSSA